MRLFSILQQWILAVLSFLAVASTATAETPSDFGSAQALIQSAMQRDGIPSVAVAVSRHGRIVWETAFGWADKEQRIPATIHTPYALASVTKTLTATGLLALQAQGRLSFERPVNDYLGDAKVWSPFWDPAGVTARRLATHTAGLTTYSEICYADETACSASTEEMIRRYAFVGWRPGDHFDYSNVGYGVLGAVIAHVAGKPYAEAMRDLVFRPTGMRDCSIGADPRIAVSYDGERKRTPAKEEAAQGASSENCSVHDLIRWGMVELKDHPSGSRPFASDAALSASQDDAVPSDGDDSYSVGGWWVSKARHGYRVIYASGGTSYASANVYLVPSEDIAVAVVLNTGDAKGLGDEIADRVLGSLLPAYAADLAKPRAPSTPATTAPVNDLGKFAGTWDGEITTYLGKRRIRLVVDPNATARVSIDGSPLSPAPRARFEGGRLLFRSTAATDLGTPDANRRQHRLGFELYPVDGIFKGAVTSVPTDSSGRDGAVLSYPIELRRTP